MAIIEAQKAPQFFHGGYSAVDYGKPQGFVNKPTLFNHSVSGRAFSAGENYKTEYIISSDQLRDPVIADFVNVMESNWGVRRFEAGGYSNAQRKSSSGTSAAAAAPTIDTSAFVEEQRLTREAINNIELVWSWRRFHEENARMVKLEDSANA